VCIHKAHFLSSPCSVVSQVRLTRGWPARLHAWNSCSVFTALLCGCSVVKLNFYFHQTPSWLWLVRTNSPIFTQPVYRPVCTMVQITLDSTVLWTCVKSMNTRTLYLDRIKMADDHREYPDSSISKILTILKWRMIMTLNRKCWKSRGYRTTLLPRKQSGSVPSLPSHFNFLFLHLITLFSGFYDVTLSY